MNRITLPVAIAALSVTLGAYALDTPKDLLGDVVPVTEASRHIDITPQTRYVNVNEDDTVSFTSNGQSFAIHFDGVSRAFDIGQLAPAGALDHRVTAYVAPSLYDR